MAAYLMGAVAVPLSVKFGPEAALFRMGDSGSVAAVFDADCYERLVDELAELIHQENGKPVSDAVLETVLTVEHIKWAEDNASKVLASRNVSPGMLFSNFKDALPLDDDGRRFCVLFSRWQRKAALEAFTDENPDYYTRLYRAIEESAGAIRHWLMNHEQDDEFKP